MPGSEGGGWKRAQKSNALTAYPTPECVCLEALRATIKSYIPFEEMEKRWHVGKNPQCFSLGSLSSAENGCPLHFCNCCPLYSYF